MNKQVTIENLRDARNRLENKVRLLAFPIDEKPEEMEQIRKLVERVISASFHQPQHWPTWLDEFRKNSGPRV